MTYDAEGSNDGTEFTVWATNPQFPNGFCVEWLELTGTFGPECDGGSGTWVNSAGDRGQFQWIRVG